MIFVAAAPLAPPLPTLDCLRCRMQKICEAEFSQEKQDQLPDVNVMARVAECLVTREIIFVVVSCFYRFVSENQLHPPGLPPFDSTLAADEHARTVTEVLRLTLKVQSGGIRGNQSGLGATERGEENRKQITLEVKSYQNARTNAGAHTHYLLSFLVS